MDITAHQSQHWSGDSVETLISAEIKYQNLDQINSGPTLVWTDLPNVRQHFAIRSDKVCFHSKLLVMVSNHSETR
jgi:hypothetical protein